jgi:hypothetical protein
MRLDRLSRFAAAAMVLVTAACSDAPVGPDIIASGAPSLAKRTTETVTVTTFTVDPKVGGTFQIQDNIIWFGKNSICDPDKSTYGVTEWDSPCELLTTPITITATATQLSRGHWVVDFQPALRFVHGDDTDRWVYLYMKTEKQYRNGDALPPILWEALPNVWVNESLTDPTLEVQWYDRNHIYRRIRHFSGYMVGASRTSDSTAVVIETAM